MSSTQKRVMLVAPSSDDRRDLAAALLDFGMDVVLADDAGRALRQLGDGVDVLILHQAERKLACESLARLAASKRADLRLFALGREPSWRINIAASTLSTSGSQAAQELARHLGIAQAPEGPTLSAEALLWTSPRSSVQVMLARRQGDGHVAYLRTQCEWADDWRDAFIAALKRAKGSGVLALELAWIDDVGVNALATLRPGRSLLQQTASQTLSLDEAAPIVRALLATMDKMHHAREPFLFGPVSAGQVWLESEGPRFLFAGATRIAYNYDRSLRGRSYPLLSIPASAEELLGNGGNPSSDVFYAAVLLYELLTGCEPFPKQAVAAYLDAIRSGKFRDIHVYVPALDPDVARVIHAALSPVSESRPDVADFARALGG